MKNGDYEIVVAPTEYPGRKYRGRYIYVHHKVWWENTGDIAPKDYVIHHKNEDKRDNRFDNLELKSRDAHTSEHRQKVPKQILSCCTCSSMFKMEPRNYRYKKSQGQTRFFCSRKCIRYK